MSKTAVKRVLASMKKDEIIKMVLELYDARKEAKEYLEYYAAPDEKSKLEEYKQIIKNEFYPPKNRNPKMRLSVCRKAISDFKKLKPSSEALADLLVSYMENACRFTYDYGNMWEQYYESVEGNFEKTVQFIAKNNLWAQFDARLRLCLRWASVCGWFFPDILSQHYHDAKEMAEQPED